MSAEDACNAGEEAGVSIEHTFREHFPDKGSSAFSGLKRPVTKLAASPCGNKNVRSSPEVSHGLVPRRGSALLRQRAEGTDGKDGRRGEGD
mmetsp:Transcript_6649/g.19669  ORF Transcript_6649/g.19669 Transcript_6649/m.19669 type:complete len:91 (-) Transcript_6649:1307-1579(-)